MASLLVLDTNVLVDQQRGDEHAAGFIADAAARYATAIHPVTAAEIIAGSRDRRSLTRSQVLLSPFRMLAVRNSDFVVAIDLLSRHHLNVSAGWPDCLIAATCLRLELPLVTRNDKHFRHVKGLRVIRPY